MIWKTLIVVFFTCGVLAEYKISDEHRQSVKDLLKEHCEKNGAADKIGDVEKSIMSSIDCVKEIFDAETLKKEIAEAKPNGALDEVFKKYCAKAPQLKSCIHNLLAGLSPCMESEIKAHIGFGDNATSELIDFVCHKDGDRIALFIAEGGPECFQEKSSAIQECVKKQKASFSTIEAAKALSLKEKCDKYNELQNCVVKALEQCSSPTPGNMAESLFRYVRKSTSCDK